MSLLNSALKIERHVALWLFIFLLTSASIAFALYYQYVLEWEPCVLCIQIRIIMFGLTLLAFLMIFLSRIKLIRLFGFIGQSVLGVLLFLKCRELYRIEIGLDEAGCMFNAGLPSWFDLEAWLPSIFEVRSACGESPKVLFDITMAQALYYGSALALILSLLLSLLSIYALFSRPLKTS